MKKKQLTDGNYAAIDIGSNAVRLLIKRVCFGQERAVSAKEQLIRVPLRLGCDVFTKGKITKEKERKLCRLMDSFSELMKLYDVIDYKACATSAIRDAENSKKIISVLKKKTGIRVKVLTGEEEAKLIYNTHNDYGLANNDNRLYVDVGGGSTEVNLIIDSQLIFSTSYNIGTIRILSNTVDHQEWDRMERELLELAKTYSGVNILGSGGNINKLYRLVDNKDKKLQRMTVESLKAIHENLCRLSLEERVAQYNLKYDRADVIVPASHIFLSIANIMGSNYIYVPTIGLSDGIIDEIIKKKLKKVVKVDTESNDEKSEMEGEQLVTK